MSAHSYGDDGLSVAGDGLIAAPEAAAGSGVSWAAVFAGALASLAATLILVVLGTGIGLSAISPWYGAGATAAKVGVGAVIWVVVVQWLSSMVGGYLAGRLRTRWAGVHSHEAFFRDTAHGFLVWALASVAGAMLFAAVSLMGIAGATRGAADLGAAAVQGGMQGNGSGMGYAVSALLRPANPGAAPAQGGNPADLGREVAQIFANDSHDGRLALTPDDRTYVARLIAARSGLSQSDAQQRLDGVVGQVNATADDLRSKADVARKRAAQLSVIAALAMVIGAFVASAAAAYGGALRDEH